MYTADVPELCVPRIELHVLYIIATPELGEIGTMHFRCSCECLIRVFLELHFTELLHA